MQKLVWLLTFGVVTPAALASAIMLLVMLSAPATHPSVPANPQVLGANTALYEPQTFPEPQTGFQVTTEDARGLIVKNYLAKYDSPLQDFSDLEVSISDKYSLDFRLLVAIAQQESNLCKKIPEDSHNCWGFGIYGDKVTRFGSYPEALETVAKTLKEQYLDQGLHTPEEIMTKYTPPSIEKGGPWAIGVKQFLAELE